MFTKLFSLMALPVLLVLPVGLTLFGPGLAPEKPNAKDCCDVQAACCSTNEACCAAAAKADCCALDKDCCLVGAECCVEATAKEVKKSCCPGICCPSDCCDNACCGK